MKDETAAARKKKQRESAMKWLKVYAYGLSPDALVTAAINGKVKLQWLERPVTVTKNDKVSKKK